MIHEARINSHILCIEKLEAGKTKYKKLSKFLMNELQSLKKVISSFNLESQDVNGRSSCKVPGCLGQGNVQNKEFYGRHLTEKNCPLLYHRTITNSDEIINELRILNTTLSTEIQITKIKNE